MTNIFFIIMSLASAWLATGFVVWLIRTIVAKLDCDFVTFSLPVHLLFGPITPPALLLVFLVERYLLKEGAVHHLNGML